MNNFNQKYVGALLVLALFCWNPLAAQLNVNGGQSATDLANILTGAGVDISNATMSCPGSSSGSFSNGNTTNIGLDAGVLLTSGSINNAPGPNNSGSTSTNNGAPGDACLAPLTSGTNLDACKLEFDVIPVGDKVTFRYVFASEEYAEFFCTQFNDVFGFFVDGPNPGGGNYVKENIALIPGTSTPVAINNLGPGSCGGINNSGLYQSNGGNSIEYDGFTVVLTAEVDLEPCQTYHFTLAIADVADRIYDSGVFIEAGSFASNDLLASIDVTQPICSTIGGSVDLTVSGGVPPYDILYSNGAMTEDVSGLAPGNYNVIITDALGCTQQIFFTINQPLDTQDPEFNGNISDVDLYTDDGADCPQDAFNECVAFFTPKVGDEFTPGASFSLANTTQNYPGPGGFSDDYTAQGDIKLILVFFSKFTNGCVANITLGWVLEDDCGKRSDMFFQKFNVYDDTKPTLNCSGLNLTVYSDDDACGTDVTVPAPIASDNCLGVETLEARVRPVDENNNNIGPWGAWTSDPSGFYAVGRYKIRWRAIDFCGNSRGCTRYLEVVDNVDPVIDCFNQTINFNGEDEIVLVLGDLTAATDNCGLASLTIDPTSISCEQLGEDVVVTATAVDIHGNDSTCDAIVTVDGLPCGWYTEENMVDCEGEADYDVPTETFFLTSIDCHNASTDDTDEYAFVQTELCGDGEIIAQVTNVDGNAFGWAGVMMRESNDPGSKMVSLMTSLSTTHRTEVRYTDDGIVQLYGTGSLGRHWLKITRIGSQFRCYSSFNGMFWNLKHVFTVSMDDCLQVGLNLNSFVGSGDQNASFNNVEVTEFGGAPFQANLDNPESTLKNKRSFTAFPNPSTGKMTVNLMDFMDQEATLDVMDATGAPVQALRSGIIEQSTQQVDLSGLPAGMYFLRLRLTDGTEEVQRIIIQ